MSLPDHIHHLRVHIHFVDGVGLLQVAAGLALQPRQVVLEVALQLALQALEGDLLDGVREEAILGLHHVHLLVHAPLLVQDLPLLGEQRLLLVRQLQLQVTDDNLLGSQGLHQLLLTLGQLEVQDEGIFRGNFILTWCRMKDEIRGD